MAFCTNCGKELSDQAPYCPHCGTARAVPKSAGVEIQKAVEGAVHRVEGAVRQTEGLAIASLGLAIASFLIVPLLPAIFAVVLGMRARERIRANPGLQGDGMALAGIIIGRINIGVMLLALLFIFAVFRAVGS